MDPERLTILFYKDGDDHVATFEDFVNLQESPAGYGKTKLEAVTALLMSPEGGARL